MFDLALDLVAHPVWRWAIGLSLLFGGTMLLSIPWWCGSAFDSCDHCESQRVWLDDDGIRCADCLRLLRDYDGNNF